MRCGWAAVVVLAFAVVAGAAEPTGPWGARVGSGTTVDVEFPSGAGDRTDDFAIEAVRGQWIQADVVAWRERATQFLLYRGDGTMVTAADGASVTPRSDSAAYDGRLAFVADATDTYLVRLASSPASPGSSAPGSVRLAFRRMRRPAAEKIDATPDAAGEVRFSVAARGGARITLDVRPVGGVVAARDATDPEGRPLPGALSAFRRKGTGLRLARYRVPDDGVFGDHEFVLDSAAGAVPSAVRVVARVEGGETPAPRRLRFRGLWRPGIVSVTPSAVVDGTVLTFRGDLVPPGTKKPSVRLALGPHELEDVTFPDPNDLRMATGRVPAGLALRPWDAVVEAASGQVAARSGAVSTVARPAALSVDPPYGPSFGGFEATIRGTGLRVGRIGIRIDGQIAPAVLRDATATSVRFLVPAHADGVATLGVADLETGAVSDVPYDFSFTTDPVLTRVEPTLVPELGGVEVTLRGGNFFPGTHVFLERDDSPGRFVDVTPGGALVDATTLRFTAPVRARGLRRLHVRNVDDPGGDPSNERAVTYFAFADATQSLGLAAAPPETFDAWTSACADFDGDGDDDLFLARRGIGAAALASALRVLRSDGAGGLTDATAEVVPPPPAGDDWRADRIVVTDMDEDGRPDVVLATNDRDVPGPERSHVRILRNEARTPSAAANDRVFRDRTTDLFPPPRTMTRQFAPQNVTPTYVSDDWRGLDLWVGDLDASGGRPEIVLTHDETKEDGGVGAYDGVSCTPYCSSPYSGGYAYRMYWGGTRAFRWDPAARGGRGRYRFDANAFPRRAALTIWIYGAPPGVALSVCNGFTPCRGTFLPMIGKRVAVGRIDADAKPDVAVLHDGVVTQSGATISSLQVVVQRSGTWNFSDLTPSLTALSSDLSGRDVVAGRMSDARGDASIVAVARPTLVGGRPLRVFRFVAGTLPSDLGTLEEITDSALPPAQGADHWQCDDLQFADADGDGTRDLLLLSAAPPASGSALRILRGVLSDDGTVAFLPTLADMLATVATPADRFDGATLALGDLDRDGLPEFLVSRAAPSLSTVQTRAVRIAR